MNAGRTRRKFLGSAAAAGWAGARPYTAGGAAKPGPNETVNLALIGCRTDGHQPWVCQSNPWLAVNCRILAKLNLKLTTIRAL